MNNAPHILPLPLLGQTKKRPTSSEVDLFLDCQGFGRIPDLKPMLPIQGAVCRELDFPTLTRLYREILFPIHGGG